MYKMNKNGYAKNDKKCNLQKCQAYDIKTNAVPFIFQCKIAQESRFDIDLKQIEKHRPFLSFFAGR